MAHSSQRKFGHERHYCIADWTLMLSLSRENTYMSLIVFADNNEEKSSIQRGPSTR